MPHEEKDKILRKLEKMLAVDAYLRESAQFVNETTWGERFDIPLPVFLEITVDPNLKLFMGMETRTRQVIPTA